MYDTILRILAIFIFITGVAISVYHRAKAERASDEKISLKEEGMPILLALRLGELLL